MSTNMPELTQTKENVEDIKAKILIVDDVLANIKVLKETLKTDFKIIFALNGNKAIEIVKSDPPDLILLDIMMPDMDGYEVCRILKSDPKTRNIPIIFLTARTDTEDETKGLQLGAVDYIVKPINPAIVSARVNTHLNLANRTAELRQSLTDLDLRNRFIRQTFGRYLSDEIVNSILENPSGMNLGGEKRNVTILMSDIRGFTPICESLPPEDVVGLLNIYLGKMTDIIFKYQGTIDEFLGDGILTIFGAPIQREDDAVRAVACALEMQLAMEEVNLLNQQKKYPQISIGVGINTGNLVVGNIGSFKRTKYGAVGHNINLTSRIESYTKGGQILISAQTLSACGPILHINESFNVTPKGVKDPITIFDIGGISGEYSISLSKTPSISN